MIQKKWFVKETPPESVVTDLKEKLAVNVSMAQLLWQRNIQSFDDARSFFRPDWSEHHDPFQMKNMDLAVERIEKALASDEKILLFGDYDVDGTTAVATMWNVLSKHVKHLEFYIPDRYVEGYGVSSQGVDYAHENGFSLIIALDCGIKAVDQIAYAKSFGIDFIVCDHHEPGKILPDGIMLDPKQEDCSYPYKELSGCGVGFKLLQALTQKLNWEESLLKEQLDLLAISIAADIVPITGENRMFCYLGLKQLNAYPRAGISALLEKAKKELPLSLTNVVFILAPRINAAGRIHTGKTAVELLISTDAKQLEELATSIHLDNEERRELDQAITAEALKQVEEEEGYENRKSTLVFDPSWHKGVIGIVASRLIESHYRPTIVLTESNGKAGGSARSIRGLDMHEALEACSDLLEQYGGHFFAAGMTLPLENVPAFKKRFEEVVDARLTAADLVPTQNIDLELDFNSIFEPTESLETVPKFKRILNQLEPHGPGNMKPVFLTKNVFVTDYRILKDVHLKLSIIQHGSKLNLDGIFFSAAAYLDLVSSGEALDIVYTIETNAWRDKEKLQLNIKDIRPTV